MNPHYVSVASRADHRCEYCRAPEAFFNFPFEVEHIIPISRACDDSQANLALSCRSCNLFKSDFVDGLDEETEEKADLFDPRSDLWNDHFLFSQDLGRIDGVTAKGRATVNRLGMNRASQMNARLLWARLGFYP